MSEYKTPAKIQVEAIECGAVSFWIILGYFGKWISSENARAQVNISKDGSSGLDIANALRSQGFTSEGYQLSAEQLAGESPECGFPCIAWINKVHWVVVEKYQKGNFFISDPAKGHRKSTLENFRKEFSQLVISAVPTKEFKKEGSKPNPLGDVLFLLKRYKIALIVYITLGVFSTIPTVALSSFVGFFTDTLLDEKSLSNSYIWLLLLLVGTSFLFAYLQKIVLRRIHLSMLAKLIEKSYSKLLSLPVSFYPLRDLGEISQRVTLTINLSNILTGPLSSAVVGLFSLLIYAGVMLSYNVTLGALVIFLGLVNFYTLISVSSALSKLSQQSSMQTGKMTSNILYIANNFQQVKANGQESALFQQWSDNFSLNQDNSQKSSYIQKRNAATTGFLNQLSDYIIVILSGLLILFGKMGLGELLSFRMIALAFLSPINSLSSVNSQFSNALGDINRLKDLWDAEDDQIVKREFAEEDLKNNQSIFTEGAELITKQDNVETKQKNLVPNLIFENLSYKFTENSDLIIDNASATLVSGDLISLTGPPGSGKSTLLKCLANLITCKSDNFIINNRDINNISEIEVRGISSYVSQTPFFFGGTVLDNITLYDESISLSHVYKTISMLELDQLMIDLPQGLNTELGSSSPISATSQLYIHLLRSLIRNPEILLVDIPLDTLPPKDSTTLVEKLSFISEIIILNTRSPDIVSMCNRSFVLHNSKLIETKPQDLSETLLSRQSGVKVS